MHFHPSRWIPGGQQPMVLISTKITYFRDRISKNALRILKTVRMHICAKYYFSIERPHQTAADWRLDRFETSEIKASVWFHLLYEYRFLNRESSSLPEKTCKTQKSYIFCHNIVTFVENILTEWISKSDFLVISTIFVTDRHFLLGNSKSERLLGVGLRRSWTK